MTTTPTISEVLAKLKRLDSDDMLRFVVEMPRQILAAVKTSQDFHSGDIPLDHSKLHLLGLGGSAIAGELLRDILSPRKNISIHRGTDVPRDKRGVIVSSYSGNTLEIIELARRVTGGLRTVLFFCSGGGLESLGRELDLPVWSIPKGYQPRAAVGWSMTYIAAAAERWGVCQDFVRRLSAAAAKLNADLNSGSLEDNPLVQSALPIAQSIVGRNTVIFHSIGSAGLARRFAAQINENGKQPAFPLVIPEALHNGVEGIGSADPTKTCLIFIPDPSDPKSLSEAIFRTADYFSQRGFNCLQFPAHGAERFVSILYRLFIADIASLFLAALKGIDPTPIPTITELKAMQSKR
ncbi:MAG: hypothetical protein FJY65_01980 [Calditrichaeota bacterium]|nr:hypothetical protein [Calditrichota bacterium]